MNTTITPANPNDYFVMPYKGLYAQYRTDILERIRERMNYSLQQHSQVLGVMLTVRFPQELNATPNNVCFQYFIEEYRRILFTHEYDPQYIWVAEQNESQNHHYHLLLFLNGNKIRYFSLPPLEANEIWYRALKHFYEYTGSVEGLIHVGEAVRNQVSSHGYMIPRNNPDMQELTLTHFSYFAKLYSKIDIGNRVRVFGASQLKRG